MIKSAIFSNETKIQFAGPIHEVKVFEQINDKS